MAGAPTEQSLSRAELVRIARRPRRPKPARGRAAFGLPSGNRDLDHSGVLGEVAANLGADAECRRSRLLARQRDPDTVEHSRQ